MRLFTSEHKLRFYCTDSSKLIHMQYNVKTYVT